MAKMINSTNKKNGKECKDLLLDKRFENCNSEKEVEDKAYQIMFYFFNNISQMITDHAWDHSLRRYGRVNDDRDLSYFFSKEEMLGAIKLCVSENVKDLIGFLKTDYSRIVIRCTTPFECGIRYPKGTGKDHPIKSDKVCVVIAKNNLDPSKLDVVTAYLT